MSYTTVVAEVSESARAAELQGQEGTGIVFTTALEAVAVAVHLQDVHVVGEAVQQRSGESLRPEHLGPFVEGLVGCYEGSTLVTFRPKPRGCQAKDGAQTHRIAVVADKGSVERSTSLTA